MKSLAGSIFEGLIMNSRLASRRLSSEKSSVLTKEALQDLNLQDFDVMEGWEPTPGKIYTKVRAISARINQNYDAWPSDELKKSYRTFLGKPVFVNHVNDDPRKARGVVVAARFVENDDDKYVEVIQEVDADRFPMLAHELVTGGLDSVSMGAEARICKCSYCGNEANDMLTMCSHVLGQKGQILGKVNEDGTREDILVYEECRDISFFELSYVFDPADETAVVSNVLTANKKRGYGETALPPQVDTLRDEEEDLGSYFIEPPEEFQEPDLDKEYPDIDSEDPSNDRRVEEQREDYDMARVSRNNRRRNSRRRSDLRRMANDPYAGWVGGDSYDYKASDDGVYRFVTPKDDGSFSWGVGYNHDDPDSQFGGPDWAVMSDEGDAVDWEEAVDIADSRGADLSVDFRNRRSNHRRRHANPADIIEQLIQRGELSPAARNMDPEEVAFQYNESNALDEGDPDYLRFSRRRYAEEYGRNDQGEQEEVYISQTPPAEPLETGAGASDAPNNSQGDRVKTDRNRSTHTNFEARRRARRKRAETLLPGERVEWIDSMGNVEPDEAEILGIVGEEGGEAIYEIRWDDGATETAPEGVLRRASRRSSRRRRSNRRHALDKNFYEEFLNFAEQQGIDFNEVENQNEDELYRFDEAMYDFLDVNSVDDDDRIYDLMDASSSFGAYSPGGNDHLHGPFEDVPVTPPSTDDWMRGRPRSSSRKRRSRRRHAAPEIYKDFLDYARGQGADLDYMQDMYDRNYQSNGMDDEADRAVYELETMMSDYAGGDDDVFYQLLDAPGSYEINHPNNFRGASRKRRSNRRRRIANPTRLLTDDLAEMAGLSVPLASGWEVINNPNLPSPILYKEITDFDGLEVSPLDDGSFSWAVTRGMKRAESGFAHSVEEAQAQAEAAYGQRSASRRRFAEQSDDFDLNSRADIARNVEDEDLFEAPVETQPKDASRKRRRARRRHANPQDIIEQMIQRRELSPAARDMDPEEVAFQYNESNALNEGDPDYLRFSRRRRMADTNLDLAAPDGRVNVEAPVSGVTDADAQASQFDKGDYGHNAGDGLADPDLSTDQNWAPGEGKTSTRKASQIEGMRLAEAMVEAGLEKHDDRWKLAESYTKLPAAIVRDRITLLSRTASVKTPSRDDNGQRPMKSARKSPGLGNGPSLRKVADNKTDDYSLYF